MMRGLPLFLLLSFAFLPLTASAASVHHYSFQLSGGNWTTVAQKHPKLFAASMQRDLAMALGIEPAKQITSVTMDFGSITNDSVTVHVSIDLQNASAPTPNVTALVTSSSTSSTGSSWLNAASSSYSLATTGLASSSSSSQPSPIAVAAVTETATGAPTNAGGTAAPGVLPTIVSGSGSSSSSPNPSSSSATNAPPGGASGSGGPQANNAPFQENHCGTACAIFFSAIAFAVVLVLVICIVVFVLYRRASDTKREPKGKQKTDNGPTCEQTTEPFPDGQQQDSHSNGLPDDHDFHPDSNSEFWWSPSRELFWDPKTSMYYNPKTDAWSA